MGGRVFSFHYFYIVIVIVLVQFCYTMGLICYWCVHLASIFVTYKIMK